MTSATIRASTPMYLMSRKIKATRWCSPGEGADEVFGGYLTHKAPDAREFHEEIRAGAAYVRLRARQQGDVRSGR